MTQEQVASTGQVPSAGTVPPIGVKPLEPSPDEVLNQKIAEAVAKAVAEETIKAQRAIQSAKDKATAEVTAAQRRARMAENTMGAVHSQIKALDPDIAKEMELAEYRAKEQSRLSSEQEEQAMQYQAQVVQKFHENMNQFVVGLGVSPTDPRIDWAGDAPDLLTAQGRILESVTKIQKENVKNLEMSIDSKIKEAEKRIKKDLGVDEVNSVSTQMSAGVSSDGIPTNMTQFRKWAEKLPQKEYEEKAAKINEMLRQGKIK